MFCPKCGSTVTDGARYCPKCGMQMPSRGPVGSGAAPYNNAPNFPRTTPPGTPAPGTPVPGSQVPTVLPSKRSRWPMMVAAIVAAFIVVIGAGFYVVMPAIAGPNYINPLDFSDEAQVRREFDSFMTSFTELDLENPQGKIADLIDPEALDQLPYVLGFMDDQGIDIQRLWDATMDRFDYSIDRVNVSGNMATVQVTAQLPDVQSISGKLMQDEDVYGMTSRERYDLFLQSLSDPSVPMADSTETFYFVKKNGEWVLSDENGTPLTDLV